MTNFDRLEYLILKNIDEQCSDAEFGEMCELIRHDQQALRHYIDFVSLCADMQQSDVSSSATGSLFGLDQAKLADVLLMLANNEQAAEPIPVDNPEPVADIEICSIPAVVPFKKKISKFHTFITAIAALLLMAISLLIMFPMQPSVPLGKVSATMNAVWKNGDNYYSGNNIYARSTLKLEQGCAVLTFNNNAEIVIQSPAEIEIENDKQIFLTSGKISAVIPETAEGFIVRTIGASVVDYGTEFGVTTDKTGTTQAHVFLGNVELRSGSDPVRFTGRKTLVGGEACFVKDGILSDKITKAQPESFIRNLPTKKTFGVPGHRIDLVDILGKGSGFGSSREDVCIDPRTGLVSSKITFDNRFATEYRYHQITNIPCVDGVFVPLGTNKPEVISSKGHIFIDSPTTSGCYWSDISNNPVTSMNSFYDKDPDIEPAKCNNIIYGSDLHPAITVHANAGITFDLDQIRAMNPGARISGFSTICGVSDTLNRADRYPDQVADMWILLDGETIHNVQIGTKKTSTLVEMEIMDNHKFLTLISTEGPDGTGGDWTFFGDAGLMLEPN